MPQPSSTTRIKSAPPCSISTSIRLAPASTEFSSSSFTTLAGRSITSPAAILVMTAGGSWWRRGMFLSLLVFISGLFLSSTGILFFQSPFLDFSIQRSFADAEHAGGFFAIAAGQLESLLDVIALDLRERPAYHAGGTG